MYCWWHLVHLGPTTHYAEISPSGAHSNRHITGDDDSPLKWDVTQQNWYIQVDGSQNTIYTTLQSNTTYQNLGFTPTTFIRRVPDARNLVDRIYRYRYVLDKDAFPVPRTPITGFVIQPRSSETNSPAYSRTYYICAVETYQEFVRGVTDGIYYLTLLNASVSPTTTNFNDFFFSQQTVDLYLHLTEIILLQILQHLSPLQTMKSWKLVETTDSASPTPNENTQLSITKETTQYYLQESQNNLGYTTASNVLNGISVTARLGQMQRKKKIPLKLNADSSVQPLLVETRRYSILRASGHTFEYLGFGPSNYSTAFPSTRWKCYLLLKD